MCIKIPEIGIGMLGCGFISRLHNDSLIRMPHIFWPPPAKPKLIKICDINEKMAREAVERYGYIDYCTDWHDLVNDDRIQILINVGPNIIHADPCIAAAKAGKHIICEKPLGRNKEEAKKMLDAVQKAKIKHLCNFNFRMIPALALARNIISEGILGKIHHFRANWLEEWLVSPETPLTWRSSKKFSGSGIIGDLGAHMLDLGRWLCGEIINVTAVAKTFIKERPSEFDARKKIKVDVNDAVISILEFDNGAFGYLECSAFGSGHKEFTAIELNGENGSIVWNQDDINYLNVYLNEKENKHIQGFRRVSVTESFHPYYEKWWSPGLSIGYESSFVHTDYNMINSIVNNKPLEPMTATFEDGYKINVIIDTILKSLKSDKKEAVLY